MSTAQNVLSPVGRLVWGSVHKAQTTDAEGKALVIKSGPNAGQPTQRYAFGIAVPKTPGVTAWWNEAHPLFRAVLTVGQAAFPNGQTQRPDFAWKILDGDSTIPNKRGKLPKDQQGYPGHWILSFSSSFPPTCWNSTGAQAVPPESIKTGYYVQVSGSVDGNNSPNQPGVYLNHRMVALAAYGEEIMQGPDPTSVGFGQGVQLPAGASATPPAAFNPQMAPAMPGTVAPAMPAMPVAVAPAPTVVAPNPGFLAPAANGAAPAPAPVAPVAPAVPQTPQTVAGPQMTAKAGGVSYQSFREKGWTDEQMRANGYLAA